MHFVYGFYSEVTRHDLRKNSKFTRRQRLDADRYLHVSQRTYSRYENDERAIPIEILALLADFHHTSVDYLIGRTDIFSPYPKTAGQQRK